MREYTTTKLREKIKKKVFFITSCIIIIIITIVLVNYICKNIWLNSTSKDNLEEKGCKGFVSVSNRCKI